MKKAEEMSYGWLNLEHHTQVKCQLKALIFGYLFDGGHCVKDTRLKVENNIIKLVSVAIFRKLKVTLKFKLQISTFPQTMVTCTSYIY